MGDRKTSGRATARALFALCLSLRLCNGLINSPPSRACDSRGCRDISVVADNCRLERERRICCNAAKVNIARGFFLERNACVISFLIGVFISAYFTICLREQ